MISSESAVFSNSAVSRSVASGLTSWASDTIRRSDVEVAKNYLTEQELDALNKIVTAYLDIAEAHALNQEPMYYSDG